ncbi:MAG: MaoC family dehydratase N-terminal domain-containing protein [Granulosicoccus sp.]
MSGSEWRDACRGFVGRTRVLTNSLTPANTNGLLATLDDETHLGIGDALPPLFQWLYFNEPAQTRQLAEDGHEKLGIFLPPIEYPNRMWASSAMDFHAPLILGEKTQRLSSIQSVEFKSGSSGELCFVNIEHQYRQQQSLCLTDTQTIVYRENYTKKTANSVPDDSHLALADDARSIGSIVLFRYSALTFNAHRIHYDHDYCTQVSGYPGLVVHGPLMATLLARHMQQVQPDNRLSKFSFRGLAPVFADEKFTLTTKVENGIANSSLIKANGTSAMSAMAILES